MPAKRLAAELASQGLGAEIEAGIAEAITAARKRAGGGIVLIFGSVFLVEEASLDIELMF
jgi:hypothetical protein